MTHRTADRLMVVLLAALVVCLAGSFALVFTMGPSPPRPLRRFICSMPSP